MKNLISFYHILYNFLHEKVKRHSYLLAVSRTAPGGAILIVYLKKYNLFNIVVETLTINIEKLI